MKSALKIEHISKLKEEGSGLNIIQKVIFKWEVCVVVYSERLSALPYRHSPKNLLLVVVKTKNSKVHRSKVTARSELPLVVNYMGPIYH